MGDVYLKINDQTMRKDKNRGKIKSCTRFFNYCV